MPKKSIIAVLSAVVLMTIASVSLVLAISTKASADTEIVTVPVEYLNIVNGSLGNGAKGGAFTTDGKTWIEGKQYRVEIPDTVTSIGDYAFANCSGLTSITIPSSVTTIGYSAFSVCSGLTSITIPSSVTRINDYAFNRCSGLTSIEIPSSVTSIGNYAFYNCSGLTSITIPFSVTSIGIYAFFNCSGLTSITIPSSVTNIGEYAFYNCSKLTNITVGSPALLNHSALSSYKSMGYVHCRLTVAFDNGSSVDTETVDYESTVSAPSDPIRDGYTFNGWLLNGQPYNFNTPVTDNLTLTADWTTKQYTVTFNSNGGSSVDSQTVDYNAVISAPVTSRTGYTFQGWLLNGVVYDFSNPIVENMDLVADWIINQYTVTFNTNGGSAVDEQIIKYEKVVTEPANPIREGYTFKGWYNGETAYDFNTPVTDNLTLTAQWEAIPEPEPSNPEPTEPEQPEPSNPEPTEPEQPEPTNPENQEDPVQNVPTQEPDQIEENPITEPVVHARKFNAGLIAAIVGGIVFALSSVTAIVITFIINKRKK